MNSIRIIAIASAIGAIAGLGTTGNAAALPAGATQATPPAAADSGDAIAEARHWQRRCWPVYRWVWTYWGWRYRYVGARCAPAYYGPYYRPYYY